MRALGCVLVCVFLLGCGEAFSGVSATELADDAGNDSHAKDVEAVDASSTSWSDHWTSAGVDAIVLDVLEELPPDPPDTYAVDAWMADESAPDVAEAGPPLCCWLDWNASMPGTCCPAPNDPACAYPCRTGCLGMVCGVGGCSGSVRACP